MPKIKKTPEPGKVYAFDAGKGQFGVCISIRQARQDQDEQTWGKSWLVMCSSWIGDAIPEQPLPEMSSPLILNHHNWKDKAEITWAMGRPPKEFIPIGFIQMSKELSSSTSNSLGSWEGITSQLRNQWDWDNDRANVEKDDIERERKYREMREKQANDRRALLSSTTIQELSGYKFVKGWKRYPSKKATQETRRLLDELVAKLQEGTDDPGRHFQTCVRDLNDLDSKHNGFIETEEREDLFEEMELIAHSVERPDLLAIVDELRDW